MDDEQKKSGQTPGQPLPAFAPKSGRVFPKSPKQILIFERVRAFARLLRALDLFCQSVRSFLITGTAPRAYCSRRRITSVPCPFLRQSGSLACDRHHRSAILSRWGLRRRHHPCGADGKSRPVTAMDTVCSIMGYKLGRRMADVIAKDAQRPRKPRVWPSFGHHRLQCRSQAASCVWLYEMQASKLVTSPPL